ncbi:protein ELYS-like [Cuculus canorus]|uniref:protein ELYS-like n=1 Tax=Cuculus canorus TaxID=55661 RepID=UPI0023AB4FDF|nr:protein ELYS-like [Cuculus canorus]
MDRILFPYECRMQFLTAPATSSLLKFPEGTVEALGEDDPTRGSVLWGKISGGTSGLAWLARGPHFEVVNSMTGERLSAYCFSGPHGRLPTVRVVKEFSSWERPALLIGVGNDLCLFDLERSRVVKAIALPGRVIAIEPITNVGEGDASTQYLHESLQCFSGVAAVATNVGRVFLVDLCLHNFSWGQKEIEILDREYVTAAPAEVPQIRETVMGGGRHLCFQLQNSSRSAVSTLYFISRTNQLVVGFCNGTFSLWNMGTLTREHNSQLNGGRIPVSGVTFQEPENDPGNSCYLWAVQSAPKRGGGVLSFRLLQLTFGKRRRVASGQVMYEGLARCEERFGVDLRGGNSNSNMKLLGCQTIEKFSDRLDGGNSINGVMSPFISVSIFSWQVCTSGQKNPSTYLSVFDINGWLDAQMPAMLRPESLHDCPYFALWSLDTVTSPAPLDLVLDMMEEQLEVIVSTAAQTGYLDILTEYFKRWTSEGKTCQVENIQFVRECAWNRVLTRTDEFNQLCVPLFDGSFVDQKTIQSLYDCQFYLCNLSTILNCLPREEQDLSEEGFPDLTNKQVLAGHQSLYAQVVTWFCRCGLLPQGLDAGQRSSRPFYNYPLLQRCCTAQRQRLTRLSRGKWDLAGLMIDRMVSDLGERVQNLWCTDKQKTGKYPPPSLQALLQLYLLDGIEEIDKHKITMYLLLDIGWAVPGNRERLLHSFCAAFAIPKGFVQLVQGFWLLDHNDYENSLVLLCHPATARSASWLRQRAIQSLMCQGQHRRALTYIRMTRPLITSSREAQLYLSVFLSNRCMADVWNLLQQYSSDDNREELLLHMFKTCLEMGLAEGFLELPFTDTELACLEEILESSDLIEDHEFFPANHPKPVNNTAAVRVNKSAEVTLTDSWKNQMLKVLPFPRVASWCSQLLRLLPGRLQGKGTEGQQRSAEDQEAGQTEPAPAIQTAELPAIVEENTEAMLPIQE